MRLSSPELLVDITGLAGPFRDRVSEWLVEDRRAGHACPAGKIRRSQKSTSRCSRRPCRTSRMRRSATAAPSAAASRSPIRRPNTRRARSRLTLSWFIAGKRGERRVKAAEFFKGLFETDLKAGEILVGVEFPVRRLRQVRVPRAHAPPRRLRDRRARRSTTRQAVRVLRDRMRSRFSSSPRRSKRQKTRCRRRPPTSITRPPPSCTWPACCSSAHGTGSRHHADRQRHAVTPARRAAPAPRRFPAGRARADRLAHRLRARRLRRLHGARRRRDRARLPDARGAGERLPGGHDRRPVGFEGARQAAEGVPREERAAMRLLHAGHADGGAGSDSSIARRLPEKKSETTFPATTAAAPATRRSSTPLRK